MEEAKEVLLRNSLVLKSLEDEEDYILGDDMLLKELADVWTNHEKAITILIQSLTNPIARKIVLNAYPVEVVPLRHELVAMEAILGKFQTLTTEYKKRKEAEEKKNSEEGDITKENKEESSV